jgi:MFS transporter, SP family, sugar:H+ symporter
MMYCDPNCKPWNSSTWAPEGFSSRDDLIEAGRAAQNGKGPEGVEEGRIEKVGQPNGDSRASPYFAGNGAKAV